MNSDLEYLEDGFDPYSMKVATLRRILVENNVDFPSNARKNALVGLFDEKVKPQIPQLRKMYLNVKPSDEGIVRMDRPSSYPSVASPRGNRRARRGKSAPPLAKQFKKNRILDDVSHDDDDDDDERGDPLIISSGTEGEEDDEENDAMTSGSNKSDTNDFQLNSNARKKRKGPDSDDGPESNSKENKIDNSTNEHFNISCSDSEIEHDYQRAKKRKTSSLNQEHGNGSAILGKLSVKTPIKNTNRKPVSMDHFNDSMTSSGTENDLFMPNIRHNPKELGTDNGTKHSTPLGKLKVSASFADKLPQKEEPTTILIPEIEQQEHFQSEKAPSLFSSDDSGSESGASLLPEISTPGPEETVGNTSQNVIEMLETDGSDSESESDEVLVPTRIETPQLPTVIDVEKCEARVQELQEEVNEQLEDENENKFDTKEGQESGKIENSTPKRHTFKKIVKFLSKSLLALFLFCMVIVAPLLFGLWYREQRLLIGYCGHEVPSHRVNGQSPEFVQKLDNWLQDYRPKCIPCPPNGICYPYLKLKCKPDYKLAPSRLDFLEIIPAQGKCVKDDKKQQLVSEVVEKSLEFLRAKNAQISCGDGKDDIESGMTEDALYQIFNEARAPWIRDDEFEDLWIQVIKDLTEEPEILWRQVSTIYFLQKSLELLFYDNCFSDIFSNFFLIDLLTIFPYFLLAITH